MDSKDKNVELINEAVNRMLEERKNREPSAGDGVSQGGGEEGDDKDEDCRLLNRLLSQLESVKGDNDVLQRPGASTTLGVETSSAGGEIEPKNERGGEPGRDQGGDEINREEIIKELNKVKRQNTITHWLLSIMIVLTVAWQASEVTILYRIKHGLSHPFQYLGNMLSGTKKDEEHQSEAPVAASFKMPELPKMEMPDFGVTNETD